MRSLQGTLPWLPGLRPSTESNWSSQGPTEHSYLQLGTASEASLLKPLRCFSISPPVQEANCINKSLTFLEQAVNALSRREAHVPYRQSKLTSVLRDALGGNCRTVGIHSVQLKRLGGIIVPEPATGPSARPG